MKMKINVGKSKVLVVKKDQKGSCEKVSGEETVKERKCWSIRVV